MKTVLLTDDNEDIIELVELILSKFGCKLDKADNAQAAVTYCQQTPPDLVIMDLNMPDMDGFSAIEAIRQNGYKNHIVVLTASDSETDRERAMGLGIDAYIIKTMEMSDLESKVYQLLNFSE